LTDIRTLSQVSDQSGSIAPDLLSAADEKYECSSADVVSGGRLADSIVRVIDIYTDAPIISEAVLHDSMHFSDPGVLVSYDPPAMPAMPDFGPLTSLPLPKAETGPGIESGFEPVIPKAFYDKAETAPAPPVAEAGIAVEIPPIAHLKKGVKKVEFDTMMFNPEFRENLRKTILILIVAATNVLLIFYLLNL
jgi:hypothetical protein